MVSRRSQSKAALPSLEVAERVADTMFALSTPSRVQILGCLMEGPHSVSELIELLAMEQSAVSHQLRILREYGLVSVDRVGRRSVYALTDEHVQALLEEALRHTERRASKGLSLPLRLRRGSRGQAETG
jgi:DNA-binding transcriptional ArsR family regulator